MAEGAKWIEINTRLCAQYGENVLPQHVWVDKCFNKSSTSVIQNTQDAHPSQQAMTNRNRPETWFSRTEGTLNQHWISVKVQVNEQWMEFWDSTSSVHGGLERNWQKNTSTIMWEPGLLWCSNMTKVTVVWIASGLAKLWFYLPAGNMYKCMCKSAWFWDIQGCDIWLVKKTVPVYFSISQLWNQKKLDHINIMPIFVAR